MNARSTSTSYMEESKPRRAERMIRIGNQVEIFQWSHKTYTRRKANESADEEKRFMQLEKCRTSTENENHRDILFFGETLMDRSADGTNRHVLLFAAGGAAPE